MAETIIGIIAPFAGTTLGAASTLMMKRKISNSTNEIFIAVTLGIMLAATVSLISSCEDLLPLSAGFVIGVGVMVALELLTKLSGDKRMMLAITVHNIPEGMAVGIVLAGMLNGNNAISASGAIALAVGIAIQNFPEGAIISAPLAASGTPKGKAFACGTLSGVAEPVGAILTILVTSLVTPVLPYILAFAAGAMIYVVIEELIPESRSDEHSNVGTVGAALGFALMMLLDVALG